MDTLGVICFVVLLFLFVIYAICGMVLFRKGAIRGNADCNSVPNRYPGSYGPDDITTYGADDSITYGVDRRED